jgi:DNA polymerase delta subunit 3
VLLWLTLLDEDMPDASEAPAEPANEETEPKKEPEPEPKEEVTVQGGRRRGKRKIMKKKTVKDDEGYLGMHLNAMYGIPAY